jgi:prevent-host-death family protein
MMQSIQNYIPITRAKNEFLDMVRSLRETDDAIAITKNGIPEAVLVSMEKFEGLLETIEILADSEAVKILNQSREDRKQGRLVDMETAL